MDTDLLLELLQFRLEFLFLELCRGALLDDVSGVCLDGLLDGLLLVACLLELAGDEREHAAHLVQRRRQRVLLLLQARSLLGHVRALLALGPRTQLPQLLLAAAHQVAGRGRGRRPPLLAARELPAHLRQLPRELHQLQPVALQHSVQLLGLLVLLALGGGRLSRLLLLNHLLRAPDGSSKPQLLLAQSTLRDERKDRGTAQTTRSVIRRAMTDRLT